MTALTKLIGFLKENGVQYAVLETEEIKDYLVLPEHDDPMWFIDTATGITFGRTIVLFDDKDQMLGILSPEMFDGMEKYEFERAKPIKHRKAKI